MCAEDGLLFSAPLRVTASLDGRLRACVDAVVVATGKSRAVGKRFGIGFVPTGALPVLCDAQNVSF